LLGQQGGICYDSSGTQCNNLACPGIGSNLFIPVSLDQPTGRVTLNSAEWMQDDKLRTAINVYSRMFDAVLLAMQHLASDNTQWVRDGAEMHFYVTSRAHFPIKVMFTHLNNTWVIRTDRADPEEGVDAASMLEISGRQWKLLCHDHNSPNKLRIVSSGLY